MSSNPDGHVPVLVGTDGTAYLGQEGVTFERSGMAARGRGVGPVEMVPFSSIVGAEARGGYLRLKVAGARSTKLATSDPYTLSVRRGDSTRADTFASAVAERAAGADATPVRVELPTAPAPAAVRTSPMHDDAQAAARSAVRMTNLAYWLSLGSLALLVVGLIAIVVIALIVYQAFS